MAVRIVFKIVLAWLCCLSLAYAFDDSATLVETTEENTFYASLNKLTTVKLRKMPAIVDELAQFDDVLVPQIFEKLLSGELYYFKTNKNLAFLKHKDGQNYTLETVLDNKLFPDIKKSKIKKVKTNNKIRGMLRHHLAILNLKHPDELTRIAALKNLLNKVDEPTVELLKTRLEVESSETAIELIHTAMAVSVVSRPNTKDKTHAINTLGNSLEPAAYNMLKQAEEKLLIKLNEGVLTESDKLTLTQLSSAIKKIDGRKSIFKSIENLFFGLSLGSVLLLAAIGLAITFGVMGVINMAHGEMIMLGAYTTYVVQQIFPNLIDYSLFIAIPMAFLVSASVGILIERSVIQFLKGRPLETLLATFGISLILQQLVRTVFSPLNRQVNSPSWMSGSLEINPIFTLTYNRLYVIAFALVVFALLVLLLKKSSLGLHVRAVSQNREMARALSVKSEWVDAITFGLGSGIAGIAGVVLSQLTNVGPNLGQSYIIDSFLVVVFGGVGNLWGTLVAAFSLGTINKFLEPVTGSVLASIIVLVAIVLFIQKRPKGLFPQQGRLAD